MGMRTGRLHPHHHTSYPVLALLLTLTGLTLLALSFRTSAATLSTSGSINLRGVMPGPPPSSAPTIDTPSNGQHFIKVPVALTGSCSSGLRVVVVRNNLLAGQAFCNTSSKYELLVDLIPGKNDLFARQYDTLDQPSPASPVISLFFDKPVGAITTSPGQPPIPTLANPAVASQPFLISSTLSGLNLFPDTEFKLPIEIAGGIAPYAIHVDWGDGGSSLLSASKFGSLNAPYTYATPGVYKVVIQATDANGAAAYFQTGLTVNGKTVVPPATTTPDTKIVILWPIFIVIVALVLGF
ncbi:MAG TPA: hypothetical protein VF272_04045, partial [Candidatus Saccharimonadia bacterium]